MKKRAAQITINLVPKDPFFQTLLGRTLKWALSVGRYLVIFTELVVIISFGSRFQLDRQVTDLNDSIHQKESIIESYGDLERDFRLTQLKIEQYQQIQQQTNIADVFPALSAITPRDVRLEQLIIRPTSVTLEGTTLSQSSFNLLITNLQLSQQFFNVSVDRIEANNDKEPGFTFRLRADTKEIQQQVATPKTEEKVNLLNRTEGL